MAASLPLLLLDVDGVLNPFAAPACPPGYTEHEFFPGEEPVRLCSAHGPWLQELATRFQIVWATAWGADANRLLAPPWSISPTCPSAAFRRSPSIPATSPPRHQIRRATPADLDRRRALTPGARVGCQTTHTSPAHRHRPSRRTHPPSHRTIPAMGRSPRQTVSGRPDQLPSGPLGRRSPIGSQLMSNSLPAGSFRATP